VVDGVALVGRGLEVALLLLLLVDCMSRLVQRVQVGILDSFLLRLQLQLAVRVGSGHRPNNLGVSLALNGLLNSLDCALGINRHELRCCSLIRIEESLMTLRGLMSALAADSDNFLLL
jgi:hypothetical protein